MSIDCSSPGGGWRLTVHKFMKANCTAAQLHQDVIQVIQQLVDIGKPLQNSSHANRKNNKQKVTRKGKVPVMSYRPMGAGRIDKGTAL